MVSEMCIRDRAGEAECLRKETPEKKAGESSERGGRGSRTEAGDRAAGKSRKTAGKPPGTRGGKSGKAVRKPPGTAVNVHEDRDAQPDNGGTDSIKANAAKGRPGKTAEAERSRKTGGKAAGAERSRKTVGKTPPQTEKKTGIGERGKNRREIRGRRRRS